MNKYWKSIKQRKLFTQKLASKSMIVDMSGLVTGLTHLRE